MAYLSMAYLMSLLDCNVPINPSSVVILQEDYLSFSAKRIFWISEVIMIVVTALLQLQPRKIIIQ